MKTERLREPLVETGLSEKPGHTTCLVDTVWHSLERQAETKVAKKIRPLVRQRFR